MVIGILKNFPQGPPIFLLSVNRACTFLINTKVFAINREQQMLTTK